MNNIQPYGAVSEEQVRKLERRYHIQLPAGYREFLLTYGGGDVEVREENRILIPGTRMPEPSIIGIIHMNWRVPATKAIPTGLPIRLRNSSPCWKRRKNRKSSDSPDAACAASGLL